MERDLVERFVAVWNGGSPEALDSILTPAFVRHTSRAGHPAERPGAMKKVIAAMRLDVPDLHIAVQEIMVEGDRVAFRWNSEGTDSGPGDLPPTNKRFSTFGLTWLRLENGRIAEEWSSTDQLDALLQLGFGIRLPDESGH